MAPFVFMAAFVENYKRWKHYVRKKNPKKTPKKSKMTKDILFRPKAELHFELPY